MQGPVRPPSGRPPTPVAVLSDIHGNLQALTAVLRAARQRGASRWWCAGDIVGYGGSPAQTLARCLADAERCLAGNHDLGVAGRIPIEEFTDAAYDAVTWTQNALGPIGMAKLAHLTPSDLHHEVPMFHGSPRNPVWEYVLEVDQARDALEAVAAPLMFVGHTHIPAVWHLAEDGSVTHIDQPAGPIDLTPHRWLVNPGSVGQPRDGDPRAAWALFDPEAATVELVRTPYDVAAAQNAILTAGLPERLAVRLAMGR